LHELFYGVAFQEDCLLQCAKELLVRRGVFDGTEVKLGAGPHHQLRLVAFADGDGQADKITSVSKRTPCSVVTV
ncbi:MAG TPA: hypothetical protein DDY39_12925, partial [Nitrospira sp.]|nr:hypothetical protein [Nitrospira sp.]